MSRFIDYCEEIDKIRIKWRTHSDDVHDFCIHVNSL